MTVTSRQRPRRTIARLLGRRTEASGFYVDDTSGLLAIPVDSARVYRELPLSSSR